MLPVKFSAASKTIDRCYGGYQSRAKYCGYAEQHFKYPDNPEIQAAWNNLLKVLGKESVAQEEFVGSAIALNQ